MAVTTTLKIGGVTINRQATGVRLGELTIIGRADVPTLQFAARARGYTALPDPYSGKTVELLMDFGDTLGDILIFRGDCHGYTPSRSRIGWIHQYHATGLRDRAERIPVYDDNTGTNVLTFNGEPGPDYRASRAGRTVGQAILETLSQEVTVAALTAAQIGGFAGVGSGAVAHCVMGSSRQVVSIVVDVPGTGYDPANRVTVLLLGGGGSGAAAGNYTVTSGGIATIPVASAGSGYLSPPTVVFSKLPAITVADLSQVGLDIIPTHPVTIQGDKLFSAVEGVIEDKNPNFWFHTEPDGTLRFFDQRKFGGTVVTLSGGGSPTVPAIVVPVVLNGKVESLWIANGGLGYTSTPTIAFADPVGTGAIYALTRTGGTITGFTKTAGGSGYAGGRVKFRIDDQPLWVESFAVSRNVRDCYPRVKITGATYNQPICLKLSDGSLIENFAHDGLDNANAKLYWKYNDYTDPFETGSTAKATSSILAGAVNGLSVSNGGYGYLYTSPPAVSITPQPGSGAVVRVNINTGTGVVSSVDVISGGSGYDGPTPTLTVVGGGGTGATFSVSRSAGAITAVTVTSGGSGYSYAPTPVLSGLGAGSGATAHSVVDLGVSGGAGKVTSLVIDSGGSSYTRPPVVNIASHGGAAARSRGSCVCLTTTTIRITPSDPLVSWAANYWDRTSSGIHGTLFLTYVGPGGAIIRMTPRVTAHTALAAGGTCDLTIDQPVDNLNYVTYDLVGDATPASRVWRAYLPADTAIRTLLQDEFSFDFAVGNADGTMALRKKFRFAKIVYQPANSSKPVEQEWSFDLDRDTGQILFAQPVVKAYGTTANLTAGGASTDGIPSDIQVWIPKRSAALTSIYPADIAGVPQYAGTSSTYEALTRTKQIFMPSWRDPAQQTQMDKIAQEYHGSMSDAVVEGTFTVEHAGRGLFHPGMACDFAQMDGTICGLESVRVPVVSATIRWENEASNLFHSMSGHVSSRRQHYSAADMLAPGQHMGQMESGGEFGGGEFSMQSVYGFNESQWNYAAVQKAHDLGMNTGNEAADFFTDDRA